MNMDGLRGRLSPRDVNLVVSSGLLVRGVLGVRSSRETVIVILMSIERILLGASRQFVTWSSYLDDVLGQVSGLMILTVAAAESSIGLSILVIFFRVRGNIRMERMNSLQG
jgi:NADH-quinone oxidoreductase subunit K